MVTKEQVKEVRTRLGMNQADFGQALGGFSTDHVSRIESGKVMMPGWMGNALLGLILSRKGFSLDLDELLLYKKSKRKPG